MKRPSATIQVALNCPQRPSTRDRFGCSAKGAQDD
jgi:hypothetical protein